MRKIIINKQIKLNLVLFSALIFSLNSCKSNEQDKIQSEGNYKTELYNNENDINSEMNPILGEAEYLFDKGKYKEAIKKFEESDSIYGVNKISLSDKALCYTKLGDFKKSLVLNTNYISQFENDPTGWSNRGMVYMRLEKYKLALSDFDKSIELDPNEAGLYFNRHFVFIKLKKYSKACQDLEKALDLGYTKKYGPDAQEIYEQNCK